MLGLALLAAAPAAAQRVEVSGRVVYGPTGAPLAGTWAVLHAVRAQAQGAPLDSARTGAAGQFTLTIGQVDTAAFYVVSSWYRGIAYFSEPIPVGRPSVTLQPIAVYDTSSRGPRVMVDRRLVTIARPQSDGTRSVLELLALRNPSQTTRIASDTTHPTWSGVLPAGSLQFEVGQGDVPDEAVAVHGDSLLVVAPIPPGDPKQLSYSYVLPADMREFSLPVDQATGELDVLVEDTNTVVRGPGLEIGGVQTIDTRHFASYRARAVPAGVTLSFTFPRGPLGPQGMIPYAVGAFAAVFVLGFVVALRKPRALARAGRAG